MMKFILIAAVSILSALTSGLALPDLTRRETVIRPAIAILIKEDSPNTPFPTKIAEVSRTNGAHGVKTLLGFLVPPCTGLCTISFSDSFPPTGSRQMQLFTTGRYPASGDTWNSKPFLDRYLGTLLVSPTGAGPAIVVGGGSFDLTFGCPVTTVNLGFELDPVGDSDYVSWDITKGGLIITCN